MFNKIILLIFTLSVSSVLFADYSLDSNSDGILDIWVEELEDNSIIISSDTNFDGNVDKKLAMNGAKLTLYEETDYNLDGIMDNFYFYEDGFVVRQEVDSNYDLKIDIWVYITNDGKSISSYEKDLDFDGVVDKVKEFEVYKEDGK
ncbi:hypothetical protein EW093_02475 [Thiospirochaeta perfilievii]|uniref:VCBS repeat-containing protein n=1 Tax=Thiospirochaeta perfilievii TaxID=252967 RepID=A0A5C1Q9N2_9SPIO|nr:hypothetical protein [Thiospirochaeta perfilievii]QEN03609.1 hypothetical protein EW093_02475 [Thiospirochaeta perfilievii]